MKKFRYRSVFQRQIIRAAINIEADKYLSRASLEGLASLDIPDSLDLRKNPDLILAIYNGAVINRMNRNDDGIDKTTALAIKNQFIHKPTNLEHKKKRTVGHIVNVGWSTFGNNELLTDEDVANMDDPFNLVISSVVYRANEDKFADALIDSTDETSPLFHSISSSWEIGFDSFHIQLGSKNTSEAEIISNSKQIAELQKYLKAYGGEGETKDGVYVGRLIVGDELSVLPIGFAYTSNPAAEVEGVIVKDFSDFDDDEEEGYKESDSCETPEELAAASTNESLLTSIIKNGTQNDGFDVIKELIDIGFSLRK